MCACRLQARPWPKPRRIPIASVGVLLPISFVRSLLVARMKPTGPARSGGPDNRLRVIRERFAPSGLHCLAKPVTAWTRAGTTPALTFAVRLRASRDSVCIARALSSAARTIIYCLSRTRCSDQKRVHARLRRANGDAPQIRDRSKLRVREGPGSAAHHCMLRCARDTRGITRRENGIVCVIASHKCTQRPAQSKPKNRQNSSGAARGARNALAGWLPSP
jgi:hypothetical protein